MFCKCEVFLRKIHSRVLLEFLCFSRGQDLADILLRIAVLQIHFKGSK